MTFAVRYDLQDLRVPSWSFVKNPPRLTGNPSSQHRLDASDVLELPVVERQTQIELDLLLIRAVVLYLHEWLM